MLKGNDVYVSSCHEQEFFSLVIENHLMIYDLTITDHLRFKAHRNQKKLY